MDHGSLEQRGYPTGDGCWDTDNYWATDTSGNGATTWVAGSDANFYADSSPTSTVTIASAVSPVSVGNITFTGAGYTVTGGSLHLGGTITADQDVTIKSVIGGTAGLTLVGPGTLTVRRIEQLHGHDEHCGRRAPTDVQPAGDLVRSEQLRPPSSPAAAAWLN